MAWTKRQIVLMAFDEIGRANYVFDISPELMERAMLRLDSMMGIWEAKGMPLRYPLSANVGDSDLDESSYAPDWAIEPIYMNLAVRLAASIGKAIMPDTKQMAKDGLITIMNKFAKGSPVQMPEGMPAGQGWKQRREPYLTPPQEFISADDDTLLVDGVPLDI